MLPPGLICCSDKITAVRFFAYFDLEKMRSMLSSQRQVDLRRLGNQLPVLGKSATYRYNLIVPLSVCKIVRVLPV